MAVGCVDQGHVEPLAGCVGLGLLEAMGWREVLGLGFDESYRHRLALSIDPHAEYVVDPATGATPWPALHDFDGTGGFLPANEILGPTPPMQGRVDQLGASVSLAEPHCARSIAAA